MDPYSHDRDIHLHRNVHEAKCFHKDLYGRALSEALLDVFV